MSHTTTTPTVSPFRLNAAQIALVEKLQVRLTEMYESNKRLILYLETGDKSHLTIQKS